MPDSNAQLTENLTALAEHVGNRVVPAPFADVVNRAGAGRRRRTVTAAAGASALIVAGMVWFATGPRLGPAPSSSSPSSAASIGPTGTPTLTAAPTTRIDARAHALIADPNSYLVGIDMRADGSVGALWSRCTSPADPCEYAFAADGPEARFTVALQPDPTAPTDGTPRSRYGGQSHPVVATDRGWILDASDVTGHHYDLIDATGHVTSLVDQDSPADPRPGDIALPDSNELYDPATGRLRAAPAPRRFSTTDACVTGDGHYLTTARLQFPGAPLRPTLTRYTGASSWDTTEVPLETGQDVAPGIISCSGAHVVASFQLIVPTTSGGTTPGTIAISHDSGQTWTFRSTADLGTTFFGRPVITDDGTVRVTDATGRLIRITAAGELTRGPGGAAYTLLGSVGGTVLATHADEPRGPLLLTSETDLTVSERPLPGLGN